MTLLLTSLLLLIPLSLNAQTTCYKKGHSHVCNVITDEGEVQITECYWIGDNKFCSINNEPTTQVY